MQALYRNSGTLTKKIEVLIKKICEQCNVCKKFLRSKSRPKIGLPKATTFNETVSLDLKNVSSLINNSSDKRFVLYATDEFSKYIKGAIIPNKEQNTVTKAILKLWCLNFAGYPKRSFHADNGGEFSNETFRAFANKAGIRITLSPSYSPWANGGNERRHAVVDTTIKKVVEDNPGIALQEALDHSCYARNVEIGPHGFSPQ